MDNALRLKNIRCSVPDGDGSRLVLDIPGLELTAGSLTCVYGASGSGKTTLLSVLCGLILPDDRPGRAVEWGTARLDTMPEPARDAWRGRHVGMIFQDFKLFPHMSAMENVLLPATFRHVRVPAELVGRAAELLRRLGVRGGKARAGVLSRGEQQRVALARALLFRPSVLLADEPTASLDADNAGLVTEAFLELAADEGCTLLVVTHERLTGARVDNRLRLERGRLEPDNDTGLKNK